MKVIVAVDGASCSMKAIDFILERKWAKEDEFIILSVVEILPRDIGVGHIYATQLDQDAKTEAFEELTQNCQEKIEKVLPDNKVTSRVDLGMVVEQICTVAKEENADLIIMGSHGRKGFEHFLIGSVAEAVLKKAPCSVQIVKGKLPEHHCQEDEKDSVSQKLS